jgi:hypothetical protein
VHLQGVLQISLFGAHSVLSRFSQLTALSRLQGAVTQRFSRGAKACVRCEQTLCAVIVYV